MSTSLRQRRRREEQDEPPTGANDEEMELFVEHYTRRAAANRNSGFRNSIVCRAILLIVVATLIAAAVWQHKARGRGPSSPGQDLVLLSVYPREASPHIHELEGQTELLVTDANRPAVEAMRAAIGLANNLRYDGSHGGRRRRRKGGVAGILLGISNAISSLRSDPRGSQREGFVPGNIVLETFDEGKMRRYLLEHGGQCSKHRAQHLDHEDEPENTVLRHFDQLTTHMTTTNNHDGRLDALWKRAVNLVVWCNIANGHARGYVAHGTEIRPSVVDSRLHEMLENARLNGGGIVAKQNRGDLAAEAGDDVHRTPLFVLPQDEASRDKAMEVLSSYVDTPAAFEEASHNTAPILSTLLEISNGWLPKMHETKEYPDVDTTPLSNDVRDGSWRFLEYTAGGTNEASDVRWLARYCRDEQCFLVIDPQLNEWRERL